MKKYPEMFSNSSGTEMDVDVDTTMRTKPPIGREEKLRKVEEQLLSNKAYERFTNFDGVMSNNNLSLPQISKGQLTMQREGRFSGLHFRENYLKDAFVNQRKSIKRLWRKRSLQNGGTIFTKVTQTRSQLQ